MVIFRKTSQSSRRFAFDPEFHRQALPKRALTAMQWALQHLSDKNVSSSRRKTPSTVIRVPALPSGRKQMDCFGPHFPTRERATGAVLSTEAWPKLTVKGSPLSRTAEAVSSKKEIQKAGQSLTAPNWNASSSGPHRGNTGGSSEEDVSAAPKEPETHARFPEAHEHTSRPRGAQAPSP
jgi:hypothetical protein